MKVNVEQNVMMALAKQWAGQVVETAAYACQDFMREMINIPYPPSSKPGEPPRRRTGNLWARSFAVKRRDTDKQITWAVGNNAQYAIRLEYGEWDLAARPFVRTVYYQYAKYALKNAMYGQA